MKDFFIRIGDDLSFLTVAVSVRRSRLVWNRTSIEKAVEDCCDQCRCCNKVTRFFLQSGLLAKYFFHGGLLVK